LKDKGSIFFEKKKQKTFVTWGAPTTAVALQLTKFFCFFLFTKRRPSSLLRACLTLCHNRLKDATA